MMERMIEIRYQNETCSLVVTKGSPQASVLSPFLCNLIIDSGIRCHFTEAVEIVAFADDLVLFTKGKDLTRMTKDVRSACDIFSEWSNSMLLELTTAKTEIVIFSKMHISQQLAISLGARLFLTKVTVRYLGLELNRKSTWIDHIKSKCRKDKQMIMQAKTYVCSTCSINRQMTRKLYLAFVEPILLYAAPIWVQSTLAKSFCTRLPSTQRLMAIVITKACSTFVFN